MSSKEELLASLQESPAEPEQWASLGEILAADDETVEFDGKEYDSMECFVQALRCDPGFRPAWAHLGEALGATETIDVNGRSVGKKECCVEVLQHEPTNNVAWHTLGAVLSRGESVEVSGKSYTKQDCLNMASDQSAILIVDEGEEHPSSREQERSIPTEETHAALAGALRDDEAEEHSSKREQERSTSTEEAHAVSAAAPRAEEKWTVIPPPEAHSHFILLEMETIVKPRKDKTGEDDAEHHDCAIQSRKIDEEATVHTEKMDTEKEADHDRVEEPQAHEEPQTHPADGTVEEAKERTAVTEEVKPVEAAPKGKRMPRQRNFPEAHSHMILLETEVVIKPRKKKMEVDVKDNPAYSGEGPKSEPAADGNVPATESAPRPTDAADASVVPQKKDESEKPRATSAAARPLPTVDLQQPPVSATPPRPFTAPSGRAMEIVCPSPLRWAPSREPLSVQARLEVKGRPVNPAALFSIRCRQIRDRPPKHL